VDCAWFKSRERVTGLVGKLVRTHLLARFAVAVWLLGVGAVLFWMSRYSSTAGQSGRPPLVWPSSSALSPATTGSTLLLFVHPHCPCTRATLRELELLLAECNGALSALVLFHQPHGVPADWTKTDLWRAACRTKGVTAQVDRAGVEAKRFQAQTSGMALLYDTQSRLLFSGGITLARGHSGDNPGRSTIAALVRGTLSSPARTPVFGCPLFDDECSEPLNRSSHE
jgi:hypothetical protein